MKRIYADNAATTRISEAARNAMLRAFGLYGNPSSSHAEGREAKRKLEECRERCAKCLDCDPNEIIFTSGATESNNIAMKSTALWWTVSAIEHPSVYRNKAHELPVKPNGIIDPNEIDQFPPARYNGSAGLAVMWANNEIGTIQPVEEIGRKCESKRIKFLCDATAAVGHIPVSFRKSNATFLTLSAHKFHGPRGAGILVVRNGTTSPVRFLAGGMQEHEWRPGTENLPAIAGMTVALEKSVERMSLDREKAAVRRERLIEGLLSVPGTKLNGDAFLRVPGNANVSFDGIEGESLLMLLDANGIDASAGSACHTGTSEPSHVLTAIGRTRTEALSAVRFTLDASNTDEEIDTIIRVTRESVEYLRKFTPNKTK